MIGLRYSLYIEGWTAVFLFAIGGITFFILTIFLIIWTIWIISTREITKKTLQPIIFGVIAMLITGFEPIGLIIEKLKSPIVLIGECEHTVTSVFITLRQNGTFEYNAGAFLETEEYNGQYKISGDSLLLDYDDNQINDLPTKMTFEKMGTKIKGLICSGDTTEHRHYFLLRVNEIMK
jgi:hypothetical protein